MTAPTDSPNHFAAAGKMVGSTPSWAVIDTFRSIFEALAIVHGGDPAAAVEAHRRWSRRQGWEAE